MKKTSLVFLLFMVVIYSMSQEKPPELTNDSATLLAGETITVNVLLNDWCMEGHSMKLFFVGQGTGGSTSFTDSSITYTSYYYFKGIESISYRVIDLDNNLLSEDGYLILDVINPGQDQLDINNVSALINSYGLQFWKLYDDPNFEVPKGNRTQTIFSFNLWMGGFDENDSLKLAAEKYRQNGIDFWSGPVSDNYYPEDNILWNNLWKLNKTDIEYHKEHWMDVGYEPIDNIKKWPAYGDINNGQLQFMAPFYDNDDDDEYIVENGDSPVIRGDQSLYLVYNDDREDHTESEGGKIGAEIHGQAYAFDCPDDSVFNNSIFFHYDIINRSDTAYHDFYLGAYVDFDLGNPWDDFVGCDTLLQSFYVYNGDDYDENNTLWNPDTTFGYLDYPPAQGFVFLSNEMSSFLSYKGYSGPTGHPNDSPEYYYNLRGLWKDSTAITYGGNGYGGDTTFSFMYPGNPSNPEEWSEVSVGNAPGDRNGTAATGPYYFMPGDTIQLDLAFIFARDYEGDHLSSVALLKERIAQLRWYFENDSTPCGATWSGNEIHHTQNQHIKIYPNPVSDNLYVQLSGLGFDNSYKIYNLVGQVVQEGVIGNQNVQIHVGHLISGYYIIKISNPKIVIAKKFMKY